MTGLVVIAGLAILACGRAADCPRCDTLVIAAVGEPSSILPPTVMETVGRDVGDLVYERLANLAPGAAPIDASAFRPGLAASWERIDSLTLRFHLRPGARWHDGRPVSAEDVVFSFEVLGDSLLDHPARGILAGHVIARAEDSLTVQVRFAHSYPEQLYDATWHVRVIPAHLWRDQPAGSWAADTATARMAGSGPYRLAEWRRGQSLRLEAVDDTTPIRKVVWRFAGDPDAALNLVLSHEADLLETLGTPEREERVAADTSLRTVGYPSAVYGFLGYNVASGPAPLRDRAVRRALNMAIDRATIARAVIGEGAKAPPGPMSQLLWIWDDRVSVLPYDTAAAAKALDQLGWRRGADGMRRRGATALGFDILVPSTSLARRRLAEALQEAWRLAGVAVTVSAVEFPVFQGRLGEGKFDSYIGAWLDEPSPRSLAEQWTSDGIGVLNFGGYANPGFDRMFAGALSAGDLSTARTRWLETLDTLNADAPALFLYAPVAVAAASSRIENLTINPYSWLSELPAWRIRRP
jgi:peptide/nickel transport system substrate-binding protein